MNLRWLQPLCGGPLALCVLLGEELLNCWDAPNLLRLSWWIIIVIHHSLGFAPASHFVCDLPSLVLLNSAIVGSS